MNISDYFPAHAVTQTTGTVHYARKHADAWKLSCASAPNTPRSGRRTVTRTDEPVNCKRCLAYAARLSRLSALPVSAVTK